MAINCATVPPPAPERQLPTLGVAARQESWCGTDDVLEGPVSAVLHAGAQVYRCRLGGSPKGELLRAVHQDEELRRCLSFSDVSGSIDVTLIVDGEGRVEIAPAEEEGAPPELARCAERLRLLRATKLGCRWKVQLSLGAYSL